MRYTWGKYAWAGSNEYLAHRPVKVVHIFITYMVIIYSTNTCPYCVMAKEYFEKQGVEVVEKNVQVDQEAAKEMVEKTHQLGVPVIDVNGTIIIGFDREAIDEALKK